MWSKFPFQLCFARPLCLLQGRTDGWRFTQVERRSANCQAIFPLQQAAQVTSSRDSVCGSLGLKPGFYKRSKAVILQLKQTGHSGTQTLLGWCTV